MEKIPEYSNSEVLKRKQWYSHKTGFIDLPAVTDEYLLNIVIFWKVSRKNTMEKIKRVTLSVAKMPAGQPGIAAIIEKNNRRIAVVKLFDQLIANEIIKRKLQ